MGKPISRMTAVAVIVVLVVVVVLVYRKLAVTGPPVFPNEASRLAHTHQLQVAHGGASGGAARPGKAGQ